jgi:hypothetical protein
LLTRDIHPFIALSNGYPLDPNRVDAPQQMASPFDHFVGEQATFHFGRLARRAVGLVSRDLLLAAYHRQH